MKYNLSHNRNITFGDTGYVPIASLDRKTKRRMRKKIKNSKPTRPSKSFKITYHSNPFVTYDRDGNVVQDMRK